MGRTIRLGHGWEMLVVKMPNFVVMMVGSYDEIYAEPRRPARASLKLGSAQISASSYPKGRQSKTSRFSRNL